MAEICTKPFESVQAAITLFEQKIDPKKCSTNSNKEEKGRFLKDSSDCSLLLEAKEHEKDLALFEFDTSSKSPEELLTLLRLYKAERDNYKKFRKSQALFLEYEKGEYIFHSVSNLDADESARTAAQRQAEMMKTERTVEEENSRKQKQSSSFCPGMEEDLNVPEAEFFQSQVQLELEDLENEFFKQMIISEYLNTELKQSKEAQTIFSKTVLSAMNELDFLKSEYEQMKRVNFEGENYILEIEEERERMKEELSISLEKINGMNCMIEMLTGEIQRMQEEMSKSKIKELEFQQNITTLTSDLHNQAMLQLVVEAEEAKTEAQRLAEYNKVETENEEGDSTKNHAFIDADSNGFCAGITNSMEEYEFLILKAEQADGAKSEPTNESEVNKLKGELEAKNAQIIELRCRLEETEKRVELSEKAKLAVESQLRKWRDQRQLRRAASDAVKEYCATKNETNKQQGKPLFSKLACINPEPHGIPPLPKRSVSMHDGRKSKHIPLGKLLKIKFQSSS